MEKMVRTLREATRRKLIVWEDKGVGAKDLRLTAVEVYLLWSINAA